MADMTPPTEPVDTFSLLRARPDDPPNIRALRFAVLGMGAILILGFGAVIARIVHLTTRSPPSELTAVITSPAQPKLVGAPVNIALALPPAAKILSQSLSANRLSVHYIAGSEEAIAVVDLDTGQLVASLRVPPAKN